MAQYASEKRVSRLEVEIENLRRALSKQTELIIEMRSQLLPTPINTMYEEAIRAGGSSVVRRGSLSG